MDPFQRFEGFLIADREDELLPEKMAMWFCQQSSERQAHFINAVAIYSAEWANMRELQWRYMERILTREGRDLLLEIYEHTDGVETKE